MSTDMTKKQKEDITKFLYDMVKLTYTGFIVGGIISPKGFNLSHIVLGLSISISFFVVGYWISRKE
ncbi:MAG: hypothetical protein L3J17_13475 [Candidatus Jettenia sp.]|nr:MAG: hypothetical protein L3J17_13475 [Candidatus Jettenia sp.]